jgi:T5orf172 domain
MPKPVKYPSTSPLKTLVLEPVICDKPDAGVYVIGSTKHGWYKIGQSSMLTQRLADYRTLPFLIDVVQYVRCPMQDCRHYERALQAVVEQKRMRVNGSYSEWFALNEKDFSNLLCTLLSMKNGIS